jgi:hypothetical protein
VDRSGFGFVLVCFLVIVTLALSNGIAQSR